MKKYQSIEQFRNVIQKVRMNHDYVGKDENGNAVYNHTTPYPTLTFRGTVKLHGTNGAVVLYKDGRIQYQSRGRVLSLGSDNAGFYAAMAGLDFTPLFDQIGEFNDYIAIYGEWCGGNIQSNVAIHGLPKMFVIFDVVIDGEYQPFDLHLTIPEHLREARVFSILEVPVYFIDIDFNEPEKATNELIEMTITIENECPVGKAFGKSGIGEGIVFSEINNPSLKFKSKGEKHSSSKVKTLNAVDIEELNSLSEFVEYVCTVNRMKQGLENVESLDIKHTGTFIKWVVNDILKEEHDTIVANGIEWKKVAGLIGKKCSEFFRNV